MAHADDLAKIQNQIAQAEKQNQELSIKVASSERDIATTKKKLVRAADNVSSLEVRRAEISKKIAELDTQIDSLSREIEKNRVRISDAAAAILFVAMNPSFNSENMHDFVLTSSVLTGAADNFAENIDRANKQVAELETVRKSRAIEKEKLDRKGQLIDDIAESLINLSILALEFTLEVLSQRKQKSGGKPNGCCPR